MTEPELKFLIVDDNSGMRETLKKFVTLQGDEVIECDDGKDALSLYQHHHPDWVLMDIRMKGIGGIEATKNIVTSDLNAKVIIVTDYGDRSFQKAAKEAGAHSYVLKENLSELESIIREKT